MPLKIVVCIKQVPNSEARLRIRPDGAWIEEDDLVINEGDTFALEAARESLLRLEAYFGIPYPYEKLDLVAVLQANPGVAAQQNASRSSDVSPFGATVHGNETDAVDAWFEQF